MRPDARSSIMEYLTFTFVAHVAAMVFSMVRRGLPRSSRILPFLRFALNPESALAASACGTANGITVIRTRK